MNNNNFRCQLIDENGNYSVNFNSRVQCYYCGNEYLISSITSHWRTKCKVALEQSGKSYEDVKKRISELRKKNIEKKETSLEEEYEHRLKINKKRWIKEHEKDKPKKHYLEEWLPMCCKDHVLFWEKKSEDFDEKQFPINIRVELYSKVTKSLMDLCNNIMNFELDFKEATMEELKKLETAGDKFYRKFKFIFHPDK